MQRWNIQVILSTTRYFSTFTSIHAHNIILQSHYKDFLKWSKLCGALTVELVFFLNELLLIEN